MGRSMDAPRSSGSQKGINNNSIQFNSIYLHANLTAKGQLQSEHVKKI
jgi:hypothetical protein